MSNVSFRLATSADAGALARMMTQFSAQQMDVEKHKDDPSLRMEAVADLEARLAANAADTGGSFQALLVEVEGVACGCLIFTVTFDAVVGVHCAGIRHIFVEEVVRRQKLASHLMVNFARLAKEQGWLKIEWMVERLDLESRVFFDGLSGDSFRLHKLVYCLDQPQIDSIASALAEE